MPHSDDESSGLSSIEDTKITLPEQSLSDKFIALFDPPEMEFVKSDHFKILQWEKLIESLSLGSIQAYTGMLCSIFEEDKYLTEYKEPVNEAVQVARSEGIQIRSDLGVYLVDKLKKYPKTKGSSMLSDMLVGKKLELDVKLGVIIKIANRNNIDVSTSEILCNALID